MSPLCNGQQAATKKKGHAYFMVNVKKKSFFQHEITNILKFSSISIPIYKST